jgi:predicted ribosome quality control (RQC) complex YloA/Tae2 family protein
MTELRVRKINLNKQTNNQLGLKQLIDFKTIATPNISEGNTPNISDNETEISDEIRELNSPVQEQQSPIEVNITTKANNTFESFKNNMKNLEGYFNESYDKFNKRINKLETKLINEKQIHNKLENTKNNYKQQYEIGKMNFVVEHRKFLLYQSLLYLYFIITILCFFMYKFIF